MNRQRSLNHMKGKRVLDLGPQALETGRIAGIWDSIVACQLGQCNGPTSTFSACLGLVCLIHVPSLFPLPFFIWFFIWDFHLCVSDSNSFAAVSFTLLFLEEQRVRPFRHPKVFLQTLKNWTLLLFNLFIARWALKGLFFLFQNEKCLIFYWVFSNLI